MRNLLFLTIICGFFIISSCEENSVVSYQDENSFEILKESTYSINEYAPEYIETGNNSDLFAKVRKDSTTSAKRNIFNGILKRMNLDSTQKEKAQELLKKHGDCVQSCVKIVKLEEKRILDSAKLVRDSIKSEVDSNNISKVEGRMKIKELNMSITKLLKTLNEKYKVRECMKICDDEFIQALLPILNPMQLEQFNKWIRINKSKFERKPVKDSVDRKRDTTKKGRG